jgi:predicted ATPase/DNA-binding SARP family transcriptional activator
MALEIAILGPLDLRINGETVVVPAGRQRALLTLLAVRAPQPVLPEVAAEALWPQAAPAASLRSLHVTVSRLRRSLGAVGSALETIATGYRLAVAAGAIDARRFEMLVTEAREAHLEGHAVRARRLLDDALELWRGPALADVAYESFAQPEIARLEELRLVALEERIDTRLSQGEHGLVVAELEQLAAEHSSRERLVGMLMLALYRCGRQTEALRAYRHARDIQVEQLGIEPGPDLRALESAILAQDRGLDLETPAPTIVRGAAAARIPNPPTPTIGRDMDLAGLSSLLRQPDSRLVTLVGPGGVGKTRLAQELAHSSRDRFPDGVYFVSLAPVSSHEQVGPTIVRELDVVLLPSQSLEDGLIRHVSGWEALLVLDNFEHVMDAAVLVADLVAAASGVTLVVTSREPLRLRAERVFDVLPLSLPPEADGDAADLEQSAAVTLFVSLLRARDRAFEVDAENAAAVTRVCRRLDGLPLALELAAGRIGLLSVTDLAARLPDDLAALGPASRDAPSRQRTLTATLDWSYSLLNPEEQAAFSALAVFAGGCSVEAARAVTEAPLTVLEALVAKNVVVRALVPDGGVRLTLLETVRAFVRERLSRRTDAEDVARRHCDYYVAVAERAKQELRRSGAPAVMAEFDREVHNLEAAFQWALDRNAAVLVFRLAAAVVEYFWDRAMWREAARPLGDALALRGGDVPASLRAEVLAAYAFCLTQLGSLEAAEAAAREGLELARRIGDVAQAAAATNSLAHAAMVDNRGAEAYRYATEAARLACDAGDDFMRLDALHAMALTAPTLAEALALGEQVAAASDLAGDSRRIARLYASLPYTALCLGDLPAARRLVDDALRATAASGNAESVSVAHLNAGFVALVTGDPADAAEAFKTVLQMAKRDRYDRWAVLAVGGLAAVAAAQGSDELAAELSGAAENAAGDRLNAAVARQLDGQYFTPARERLGEQRWRERHAAGAALTSVQAIDSALSVLPSMPEAHPLNNDA